MKILITGGRGYIASSLYEFFCTKHEVTIVNRTHFDLSNYEQSKHFFKNRYFDVVMHCAISGGSRLVEDTTDVVDNNLKMYYNLLSNRDHYGKLLNFGSGAELNNPDSFYGASKSIISRSIKDKPGFYNIMIYAVFGHKELSTRFIKSNIKRYIAGEPIQVSSNRRMTFFYIDDLCRLVERVMEPYADHLNWASYSQNYSLMEVANIINTLSDHRVEIHNHGMNQYDYISPQTCNYSIDLVELEEGLRMTYEKLKINL